MRNRKRKGLFNFIRKVFYSRNIIVVSDEGVEHYPLDPKFQFVLILLIIGGFSWISYSTGSYVSAQHTLKQKEMQLATSTKHNEKIGAEYNLLKHDLQKLRDQKGELTDYARFVFDQHMANSSKLSDSAQLENDTKLGEMKNRLLERIEFLENSLLRAKEDNARIVSTVLEKTERKIKEFRDIIGQTGLNTSSLVKQGRKQLAATEELDRGAQGGPFLPDVIDEVEPKLNQNLDELMLLQSIVEQLPLDKPIKNGRTTSPFGHRYDPFTRRPAMHSGLDFVGRANAPIQAPTKGTVISAGRRGAYGNCVEIEHAFGITTRYGHLSKIMVKAGQEIDAGEVIGLQGSTGRSTGQHLHYEVRYRGKAIDPMKLIKAGKNVSQ